MGIESLMGFLEQKYHPQNASFLLLGKSKLCVAPPAGRKHNNIFTWIPPEPAWVFFPYLAMYHYHLAIINLTQEHNYMRSPMCPSNKFPKLWAVLGTSNTIRLSGKGKSRDGLKNHLFTGFRSMRKA